MTWTQKFFSFEGRMGRQDFWICTLILWAIKWTSLIVLVTMMVASAGLAGLTREGDLSDAQAIQMIMGMIVPVGVVIIIQLALIWPDLAIKVKRLHDRGQSGALVALFFLNWVPILNYLTFIPLFLFWLINLGCLEGTPGPNRYGESPDPRFGPEHAFA